MPRLVGADLTPLFRQRCPDSSSSSAPLNGNDDASSSSSPLSASATASVLAASSHFLAARSAARGPVGYLPPSASASGSGAGKGAGAEAEAEAARPEARIRMAERAWIEEAQRVAAHLHSLHLFLSAIRRPYLSTRSSRTTSAAASRTLPLPGAPVSALAAWAREAPALVDAERAQIDWAVADAIRKAMGRVEGLEEGEAVRQRTTLSSSFLSRLRPSGSFATRAHPSFSSQLAAHREAICLSLRAQLKTLSDSLRALQERHLSAAKAAARLAAGASARLNRSASSAALGAEMDAVPAPSGALGLAAPSAEQAQMFDAEASALVRVLEADLHAVQAAERRLAEISELQTTLLQHLGAQMDTTRALGEEASLHRSGVEAGNVQLEKARRSHRAATKWLAIFLVGSGLGLLFLHWMD